ncbi:MAG: hypothetical protein IBJ03_05195 [Gemmatimonadaceae bacterium]|nr:hypothetical protein [Gemmatimonadaceae bacterium]
MIISNRKHVFALCQSARLLGVVALLCSGVAWPSVAAAQRGEGPLVLRAPVSARTLAMGNANLAINDADALFANPGMLVNARGLSVSMQRYGSAATAGSAATVTTVGSMTVGVGIQLLEWRAPSFGYDEALRQGTPRLSDGGVVDAASQAATIGVGRIIKGMRFGASVKYVQDRVGGFNDRTAAFDLGFAMPFGPGSLAITAQNLGSGPRIVDYETVLPRRFGVGFGGGMFPVGEYFDIGAQTQLIVEADGFVRPAGGVELGYIPIEGVAIVFRQGLRLPREPDEPLVTAGLGVTVDRISLDYAMEPMRGGRPVSHRIGFRLK